MSLCYRFIECCRLLFFAHSNRLQDLLILFYMFIIIINLQKNAYWAYAFFGRGICFILFCTTLTYAWFAIIVINQNYCPIDRLPKTLEEK